MSSVIQQNAFGYIKIKLGRSPKPETSHKAQHATHTQYHTTWGTCQPRDEVAWGCSRSQSCKWKWKLKWRWRRWSCSWSWKWQPYAAQRSPRATWLATTTTKATLKRNETQQQQIFVQAATMAMKSLHREKGNGKRTQKRKKVGSIEEGRGNFKLTL